MVSRRNYFAITIVMFIIFFLFLSTGVITEKWNDYEVNSYSEDIKELRQAAGHIRQMEIRRKGSQDR